MDQLNPLALVLAGNARNTGRQDGAGHSGSSGHSPLRHSAGHHLPADRHGRAGRAAKHVADHLQCGIVRRAGNHLRIALSHRALLRTKLLRHLLLRKLGILLRLLLGLLRLRSRTAADAAKCLHSPAAAAGGRRGRRRAGLRERILPAKRIRRITAQPHTRHTGLKPETVRRLLRILSRHHLRLRVLSRRPQLHVRISLQLLPDLGAHLILGLRLRSRSKLLLGAGLGPLVRRALPHRDALHAGLSLLQVRRVVAPDADHLADRALILLLLFLPLPLEDLGVGEPARPVVDQPPLILARHRIDVAAAQIADVIELLEFVHRLRKPPGILLMEAAQCDLELLPTLDEQIFLGACRFKHRARQLRIEQHRHRRRHGEDQQQREAPLICAPPMRHDCGCSRFNVCRC